MTTKQRLVAVRRARRHLRAATGYDPKGPHYAAVDDVHDALEADFLREMEPPKRPWEAIGPVYPGGPSLLDMVPTHDTSGVPLFAATDTAWGKNGGVVCIAPEDCVVDTKDTSASPGEALYLTGTSGMRYWVGHLDRDWPVGKRFKRGDVLGKTLPIVGDSDHAHWGVNGEAFLGKGKEFAWGGAPGKPRRRYQAGSPTYREQLRKVAA